MVRLLIFLAALALAAFGLTWLANNPGVVDVTWRGEEYEVSLMFALGAVLALGDRDRDRVGTCCASCSASLRWSRSARSAPAGEGVPGAVARHDRRRRRRRPGRR